MALRWLMIFESGSRSALAGGNTTIIPFSLQPRGKSFRKRAGVSQACRRKMPRRLRLPSDRYGSHAYCIRSGASGACRSGYRPSKVFMTYDDMVLNDRQLLAVLECARRERALVMVHCEGYDAIKFMTERLEAAGKVAPYFHAVSRPEIRT